MSKSIINTDLILIMSFLFLLFLGCAAMLRKFKLRQHLFLTASFINFIFYFSKIIGTVTYTSSPQPEAADYIPFNNLAKYIHFVREGQGILYGYDNTIKAYAVFFIFSFLFGVFFPGFFDREKKLTYKKTFLYALALLYAIFAISLIVKAVYQVSGINTIDTSTFIFAPAFLALGIALYRIIFERKKNSDKSKGSEQDI